MIKIRRLVKYLGPVGVVLAWPLGWSDGDALGASLPAASQEASGLPQREADDYLVQWVKRIIQEEGITPENFPEKFQEAKRWCRGISECSPLGAASQEKQRLIFFHLKFRQAKEMVERKEPMGLSAISEVMFLDFFSRYEEDIGGWMAQEAS